MDIDPYGLRRLSAPARGVPRPPASEIRHRGTVRRRRRLLASVAGGVAGVLLAAGAAVAVSSMADISLPSDPNPQPTIVEPQPGEAPTLSWSQVPGTEQIWWTEPGDMSVTEETEGWPAQWAPSVCIADTDQLQAEAVLIRSFNGGSDDGLNEEVVVMEFGSQAAATQARAQIAAWYENCAERLTDDASIPDAQLTRSVAISANADFHEVMWHVDSQEWGNFETAAVVQSGARLAWLITPLHDAPDNNCTPRDGEPGGGICAVARQAPAVAEVLA